MTTPAIDLNFRYAPTTATPYDSDCDGNTYPYIESVNSRRRIESRPESQSTVKVGDYRPPTNWTHSKFDAVTVPDGGVRGHDLTYCGGGKDHVDFRVNTIDGSSEISTSIGLAIAGDSNLQQQATTKAYLALKNQKVNLSVAFAERHETAELFSRAAERIAHQIKSFKKHNFKSFTKAAAVEGTSRWRQTPKDWLEMQYGWKPLMADVSGACEAMSSREKDSKVFRAKVLGRAKRTDFDHYQLFGRGTTYQKLIIRRSHSARTELLYQLSSPLLVPFVQLGITNPLELIWERVGFSFVVDWFLPVGNWLSSFDADWGWTFLSGSDTSFVRVTSSASNSDGISSDPRFWYENQQDLCSCNGVYMRRNKLTEPPGVGLPHFKNPFSGVHVANAMSLLASAFRR